MKRVVSKFGGTSMMDAVAIRRSSKIAIENSKSNVVVVSATSGTTNQLLNLIQISQTNAWEECHIEILNVKNRHLEISKDLEVFQECEEHINELVFELETLIKGISLLKDPSPKVSDQIVSIGERLSSKLMAEHILKNTNMSAEFFDIRQVLRTDDQFQSAKPNLLEIKRLAENILVPKLLKNHFVITQGFIGSTEDGFTTTLGRGGSDYSAALIGEAVDAEEVHIWTDVAGVATTDPRLCPDAKPIRELSFTEAAELATFGAKVLHPTTIWPAMRKNMPVFVGSSMAPEEAGTWIKGISNESPLVRALAIRKNQILLTLTTPRMLGTHGFLAKVFQVFDNHQVSIDLVTTSEISIAMTLEDSTLLNKKLIKELEQFADVEIDKDLCLISLIGNNVHSTSGLSNQIFSEMVDINIRLICVGASKHNVCFLVDHLHAEEVVKRLHSKFIH